MDGFVCCLWGGDCGPHILWRKSYIYGCMHGNKQKEQMDRCISQIKMCASLLQHTHIRNNQCWSAYAGSALSILYCNVVSMCVARPDVSVDKIYTHIIMKENPCTCM